MAAREVARAARRAPWRARRPCRSSITSQCTGRTNSRVARAPAHALRNGQRIERRLHDARQQRHRVACPASCLYRRGTVPLPSSSRCSAVDRHAAALREGRGRARGLPAGVERRADRRAARLMFCSGCRDASRFTSTASRRGVANDCTSPCASPACASPSRTPARERQLQLAQRLRRQLFGAELDQKVAPLAPCRCVSHHAAPAAVAAAASPLPLQHREAQRLAARVVRLRHGPRQRAHAQDVALALGHRDGACAHRAD